MKTIINCILISLAVLSLASCDKGFKELNTHPIYATKTPPEKLLSPALVNIFSTNMSRNRGFNNELMQVTVTMSDDDYAVFRYDFRPSAANATWNSWYSELTNIRDIYAAASTEEYQNDSYKGVSLVLQAWVFQLLTDTYGDVPYSEANNGKEGLVEPAFDQQKDIYMDLLEKLDEANTLLASGKALVAGSDPVYHGDTKLWRKLCNSLQLRLLLRISGKAEVAAQVTAKMKQIIDDPGNYPVFESNEESGVLKWNGSTVTTDPFTNPFVTGLRELDVPIPTLCNFFILKLAGWQDPRISLDSKYGDGTYNRLGIAPGPGGFVGIESGYVAGAEEPKQSSFYSYSNSPYSIQKNPLAGGVIMTYSELQFILAEAAAKGWINGSAETYYYKGIANAINYWVPAFTTDITNAEFTDYIANAAGTEWNDALPLDNATGDSKMERIQLQKYYSLFMVDFQQWFEHRRTGHPILPKGDGLKNGGRMPARMYYPIYVQAANSTNYHKAIERMGADDINTLVWWQKP